MLINAASQELGQPRPGGNLVQGALSATDGRQDFSEAATPGKIIGIYLYAHDAETTLWRDLLSRESTCYKRF